MNNRNGATLLLHRHRVKTFLNEGTEKDWTCWYTNAPNPEGRNIEVQTKEFFEGQVKQLGRSKELGALYSQNQDGHLIGTTK